MFQRLGRHVNAGQREGFCHHRSWLQRAGVQNVRSHLELRQVVEHRGMDPHLLHHRLERVIGVRDGAQAETSKTMSGGPANASLTPAADCPTDPRRRLRPTVVPAPDPGSRRRLPPHEARPVAAPSRRAQKTAARPMGPAPMTSTRAPGVIGAELTPCGPTAKGSTSAPSAMETVDGNFTHCN